MKDKTVWNFFMLYTFWLEPDLGRGQNLGRRWEVDFSTIRHFYFNSLFLSSKIKIKFDKIKWNNKLIRALFNGQNFVLTWKHGFLSRVYAVHLSLAQDKLFVIHFI